LYSTVDYQLELANLSMVRSGSAATQAATTTPVVESGTSSFFSVATGYKLFTASSKNQPDPDQEDVVWNEPEQYSAVISRKEHVRDPTSLLSIRDVLRQKTTQEQPSATPPGSRFSNSATTNLINNTLGGKAASSVKAKADVAVNMQPAGGSVNGVEGLETAGTLLQELESSSTPTSRPPSVISVSIPMDSEIVEQMGSEKAPSVVSTNSNASQATIGKDVVLAAPQGQPSRLPPPLPPKDILDKGKTKETTTAKTTLLTFPPSAFPSPRPDALPPPTTSGFTNSLANGLNSAMRYMLNSESAPPSRSGSTSVPTPKKQYHALLADVASIDERPHIKYDWTIGKRLKFSCTVYYAKQFDVLRRRCGVNDMFLKSLSMSANWAAEGGKSRSNFWKTSDDRFIIKTLVNAWNVADL
jgi:1-phosphatidylinositol-3-phosphate 5-kinase